MLVIEQASSELELSSAGCSCSTDIKYTAPCVPAHLAVYIETVEIVRFHALCFVSQNVESYMSQIGQVLKMEIEESKCVCVCSCWQDTSGCMFAGALESTPY